MKIKLIISLANFNFIFVKVIAVFAFLVLTLLIDRTWWQHLIIFEVEIISRLSYNFIFTLNINIGLLNTLLFSRILGKSEHLLSFSFVISITLNSFCFFISARRQSFWLLLHYFCLKINHRMGGLSILLSNILTILL